MPDCIATWNEKFTACTQSINGQPIPAAATDDNKKLINEICASDACQQFATIFRALIATQCDAVLKEVATFPNGIWTSGYCAGTPPPTITTPPTTAPTTKPPTTTEPPTEMPNTPEPTAKTPNTTGPAPTPVPEPTVLSTQTQSPVAVTPVPSIAETTQTTQAGSKTTTIAASVGGVFLLLLVIAFFVFCRRRRRKKDADDRDKRDDFAYKTVTTAGSEDSISKSGFMLSDQSLAAVRIPLEKIRVDELISQGGYGEVARGYYNRQPVAIKRLPAGRRKEPTAIRSFFQEIQLTATLEHDCIVRFIGVAWNTPSDLCMVSEFMPGGDLRTLLLGYAKSRHANGHDDDKLRMALQIVHALTYLHTLATPVVHRDLKSRNILLSAEGDAKLIDFGISCERPEDRTMTAGVGTSLWMAPEVMLGQRYDEKADVFSFGVILSELDTHELPYDHARDPKSGQKISNMVLMQLIAQGELKPRFTVLADPDVVAVATDCLHVDPTMRPRASDVLYRIHELRQSEVFV